jgi:hypothetical protein
MIQININKYKERKRKGRKFVKKKNIISSILPIESKANIALTLGILRFTR